jgi:hypothetical protein
VVEHLIKAYPLSIRICEYSEFPKHKTFYYPMHIACGASGGAIELEIVKVLLDVFPDAAMIKDRTSRLPLHHALARNASPKCILTLLESFPWSASVPDTNGWFPLHTACEMGYSALAIRNLLQCCPEVMERQCSKKTPYEIALQRSKVVSEESLELLFVENKEHKKLL